MENIFKVIEDTSFVSKSIDVYKKYWDKCWEGHKYKQKCSFNGDIEDIEMLYYCHYELGFPEKDFYHASVIFGNVIRKHTGLLWAKDNAGNIALMSGPEHPFNYTVSIHNRIKDAMNTFHSEWEHLNLLLQKIYFEMLMAGFDAEDIPLFEKLILEQECDSDFIYSIQYELGKLLKHRNDVHSLEDVIKELRDSFNKED